MAAWLDRLPPARVGELAAVGLCEPPADEQPRTVAELLDAVLEAKRRDLKPGSADNLRKTADKLRASLGGRAVADVTPAHAAAWRAGMLDAKLARATVRTHCGNARTLWNAAVLLGMTAAGPDKGGPADAERNAPAGVGRR